MSKPSIRPDWSDTGGPTQEELKGMIARKDSTDFYVRKSLDRQARHLCSECGARTADWWVGFNGRRLCNVCSARVGRQTIQ